MQHSDVENPVLTKAAGSSLNGGGSKPLTSGVQEDDSLDLLDQFLRANNLEQLGELEKARALYTEIMALDGEGTYGMSAQKALMAMPARTDLDLRQGDDRHSPQPLPLPSTPPASKPVVAAIPLERTSRFIQLPKGIRQRWGNLSFGTKLNILIISAAVIPVLVATQTLVSLTQNKVQQDFRKNIRTDTESFIEEYVYWSRDDSRAEAENLANLVRTNAFNLFDPTDVKVNQPFILQILREGTSASDLIHAELTKSFRIITDAKGRAIEHTAKIHAGAKAGTTSPLPKPEHTVSAEEFQVIETPSGFDLSSLQIVKDAIQSGQPQTGVDLLPAKVLKQLGLETQAKVPVQSTPGLPSSSAYETELDNYEAGLVSIAVYPILSNESQPRVMGTAIVGSLLNRNNAMTDYFWKLYDKPVVSIYAQDWRVSTTAPAEDSSGVRALGTIAPKAATDKVLLEGQEDYTATEKIQGKNYQIAYLPLYDHRKALNPATKPIGMVTVARSLGDLEALLLQQQLVGLAIAGGMLLVVGLITIPIANAFGYSLKQLAQFAERVGSGETGTRLEDTARADEVGILAREMNEMATSIETNLQQVQRQESQRRQEAEQQRQEKERLQRGVIELLLQIEGAQRGDLTVEAPITSGEMGSIADAFNATIRSLRTIVMQVQSVTNEVNQLAQRSETSVRQLSSDALTQSSELTQALASVVEMSSSIQRVSQSTQEVAEIARRAAEAAQLGDTAVDQTVVSMDKIRTAVSNTAKQGKRLAEASQEISQILEIITGISEKANLLAFNASIEAARAGEQGQGFRVVAEEVRGLAQQVAESAQDIEQLISGIQQETAEMLNTMELGTTEVVTGTQLVSQTKQTLQRLNALSQQINFYMQDVATNTIEQTTASHQVNETMELVAGIAATTSNEAKTVTRSLKELLAEVQTLQTSVDQFRLE